MPTQAADGVNSKPLHELATSLIELRAAEAPVESALILGMRTKGFEFSAVFEHDGHPYIFVIIEGPEGDSLAIEKARRIPSASAAFADLYPAPQSDQIVAVTTAPEAGTADAALLGPGEALKPGDRVRAFKGDFDGWEGFVEKIVEGSAYPVNVQLDSGTTMYFTHDELERVPVAAEPALLAPSAANPSETPNSSTGVEGLPY